MGNGQWAMDKECGNEAAGESNEGWSLLFLSEGVVAIARRVAIGEGVFFVAKEERFPLPPLRARR